MPAIIRLKLIFISIALREAVPRDCDGLGGIQRKLKATLIRRIVRKRESVYALGINSRVAACLVKMVAVNHDMAVHGLIRIRQGRARLYANHRIPNIRKRIVTDDDVLHHPRFIPTIRIVGNQDRAHGHTGKRVVLDANGTACRHEDASRRNRFKRRIRNGNIRRPCGIFHDKFIRSYRSWHRFIQSKDNLRIANARHTRDHCALLRKKRRLIDVFNRIPYGKSVEAPARYA